MRIVQLALAAVWLGGFAPLLADSSEAVEVLKKAQAAVKALKAVSYEAEFRSEWAREKRIRSRVGTVTLVRGAAALPKLRVDASWLPREESCSPGLQVACDGVGVSLIDHTKRQYRRDTGPRSAMLLTRVAGLVPTGFIGRDAFADELAAESLSLAGTMRVGDVDCHIVHVKYPGGQSDARWYIGTADYLPRRVERTGTYPMGRRSQTLTLKLLDLDPVLDDKLFHLEQPEGYTAPQPAVVARRGARGPGGFLAAGTEAPDWSLKTPEGQVVTLKELRGKVVLLDFWATWCGPCKRVMPGVQKLHERFKDRSVAVYGINTKERGDAVAYMKKKGYTYGLLLKGEAVAQAYGVRGIPAFFVIDHEGKVVHSGAGSGQDEVLVRAVEQALENMK